MNENERKVVVQRMLLLIAVACIIMGLVSPDGQAVVPLPAVFLSGAGKLLAL